MIISQTKPFLEVVYTRISSYKKKIVKKVILVSILFSACCYVLKSVIVLVRNSAINIVNFH